MVTGKLRRELALYIMILPPAAVILIYAYGPMFGLVMAFQKYVPARGILGSEWIGLDNFRYMVNMPNVFRVLWNTVFIAVMKIVAGLVVPITAALLLNEVRSSRFKRVVQTVVYLPHFLSWVILSGILVDVLSPSHGIVNLALVKVGVEPIFFLGNDRVFPYTMVATDVWKDFGFGTIIYLAALTAINPELYEAAIVDGAGRWRQTFHVTLPGIMSTIVLMTALSLGHVLNAGFEQILNLYSPQVYRTGDIIDTLLYRIGLINNQYSVSTAVGFFKSVVSFFLIVLSYKLADRFANYRIF